MYKTEQENFWVGQFGDEYIQRNSSLEQLSANISMFAQIFKNMGKIESVIEFGANIGINLKAIDTLIPGIQKEAVEINKKAAEILREQGDILVHNQSILDFDATDKKDLVYTSGVLIHINPEELEKVYEKMYNISNRYILVAEYYNPNPVVIDYRGHDNKMFKRDFAGELLDKYPDLELVDYGFVYHRDNNFSYDDINWFVLEKQR